MAEGDLSSFDLVTASHVEDYVDDCKRSFISSNSISHEIMILTNSFQGYLICVKLTSRELIFLQTHAYGLVDTTRTSFLVLSVEIMCGEADDEASCIMVTLSVRVKRPNKQVLDCINISISKLLSGL